MGSRAPDAERYAFGPFRVDVAERLLVRDGRPLLVRAKVFDTLVALLRSPGRLVTREQLIAAVWPESIVEEGNLTHNVSALRRALGDGEEAVYVETVPRQGYRFVHPLGEAAPMDPRDAGALARARRDLAQGAWEEAYQAYAEAARERPLAGEDGEGFVQAARWSGRFEELVPLLEATAEAYRREQDELGTVRAVTELAALLLDRGRPALAASYLRQAERLLERRSDGGRERAAWLRAQGRARMSDGDWTAALEYALQALAAARASGDRDVETVALTDAAHVLLTLDRFGEAQRHLEEAGAALTSGEVGPYATGMAHCGLIYGWRALGRWELAREWADASTRFVDGTGVAYFPGHCRVHRGLLIGIAGELARAEDDLARGVHELARASSGFVGPAWRDLGLVRLRRGDLAGADQAFARALEVGTDPQPGLALLRRARGESAAARRDLERFLSAEGAASRRVLDRQVRFEALDALAALALEAGDLSAARDARDAMSAIAEATRSNYHRASLEGLEGALLLAEGKHAASLACLRGSLREWTSLPAPYEAALVRERIGLALLETGDVAGADREFAGAAQAFERMHATLDAQRLAERRRIATGASAPGARPMVVCGAIVDAERIRALVGAQGWTDLNQWLERTLTQCWDRHGGVPVRGADGVSAVAFADARRAVACVAYVQRSLRDHRARHGFAPRLRAACADARALAGLPTGARATPGLLELALEVLGGEAPGDVVVAAGAGPVEYAAELERLAADGFDVHIL